MGHLFTMFKRFGSGAKRSFFARKGKSDRDLCSTVISILASFLENRTGVLFFYPFKNQNFTHVLPRGLCPDKIATLWTRMQFVATSQATQSLTKENKLETNLYENFRPIYNQMRLEDHALHTIYRKFTHSLRHQT